MGIFSRRKVAKRNSTSSSSSIKAWKNRPAPIQRTETPEAMLSYPALPYDFHDCPVIYHPFSDSTVYLISDSNIPEASRAILSLNHILADAHIKNPSIPTFKLTQKHLRFRPEANLEYDDFSCFILNPFTPAGRPAKYPLKIRVRTLSQDDSYAAQTTGRQSIHGEIVYRADGTIGKVSLSCWKNKQLYPIKWTAE